MRLRRLPEAQITAEMEKIKAAHTDQARIEWHEVLDMLTEAAKARASTSPASATAPVLQTDKISIFALAKKGKTPELIGLVKEAPALLDQQDKWGWTCVMYACAYNSSDTVRALLAAGANIGSRDKDRRRAVDMVRSNRDGCTLERVKAQEEWLHDQKLPEADIAAQMEEFKAAHSEKARKEWEEILSRFADIERAKDSIRSPAQ